MTPLPSSSDSLHSCIRSQHQPQAQEGRLRPLESSAAERKAKDGAETATLEWTADKLLPVTDRSIASNAFGILGSDASGFAVYVRSGLNVSAEVRIGEARTLEKDKTIAERRFDRSMRPSDGLLVDC